MGDRLSDQKELVRSRVDLTEVVSQAVRLKRSGRGYVGLCPFHQEKTPSFTVNPHEQVWHCFGCDRGGDVFSFVMLLNNLEFRGALEVLAEMAGVELEAGSAATAGKAALRRQLLEVQQLAANYYHYVLSSTEAGAPGRRLLENRGVRAEIADRFQLGYAASGTRQDNLSRYLISKGIEVDLLVSSGVSVSRSGGPPVDRFRRRLMIPLRDDRGRVVGFTARAVGDVQPKYLNSPASLIFDKSRVLFGLAEAKQSIQQQRMAVLMEGQFDVIVSHQCGVQAAVAASGSALTADHVRLLLRLAPEAVLAFDNDDPGRRAALRAIEVAAPLGLKLKILNLGDFKDPDEFFRADESDCARRWAEAVAAAVPEWEHWLRLAVGDVDPDRPDQVRRAIGQALEVLAMIPESAVRAAYVRMVASWLRLPEDAIEQDLRRHGRKAKGQQSGTTGKVADASTLVRSSTATVGHEESMAWRLMELLALRPESLAHIRTRLDDLELLDERSAELYHHLAARIDGEGLRGSDGTIDQDWKAGWLNRLFLTERPELTLTEDQVRMQADQCIMRMRQERLRERLSQATVDLHEAERSGDKEALARRAAEVASTRRELDNLTAKLDIRA